MWKPATELPEVSKFTEGLQEEHLLGEEVRQWTSGVPWHYGRDVRWEKETIHPSHPKVAK